MPVKKVGKKFAVNEKEYDTEDAANEAYMEYVAKAMGVKPADTPKPGTSKKVPAKKPTATDAE